MIYTNNPNIVFKSIHKELWREYDFTTVDELGKSSVYTARIEKPLALHVSKSGGHRIIDSTGMAHYIPYKWIALRWMNEKDAPRLQF